MAAKFRRVNLLQSENLKSYAIIFLTAVIAMLPVYFSGYIGQDSHIHGLWVKHFSALLSEGNLYPRFAPEMNAGFGSSVFFFYPPVSFYITSLFSSFGSDDNFYFTPVLLSATLAVFVSGLTCYYWLKDRVCSLVYMLLPGHLLVDFYITGNLSQFWAYAWMPLILAGLEKNKNDVALAAISAALLIMTSIPIAIIFLPAAVVYALCITPIKKYLWLVLSGILALGISAIYLLPMLANMDYATLSIHWDPKLGVSFHENFLDNKLNPKDPQNGYRIIILLAFLMTVIPALWVAAKLPKSTKRNMAIGIILFSSFLMFSISHIIWENVDLLAKIQMPRRLLVVVSVFAVLIFSMKKLEAKQALPRALVPFILCIIFAIKASGMGGESWENVKASYKDNIEAFPTYLPSPTIIKDFYPPSKQVLQYPQISQGKILEWSSRKIVAEVEPGEVKFKRFWFPGWRAKLNGKEIQVLKECNLAVLMVKPETKGRLELTLETTKPEKLGGIISLLSLAFTVVFALYQRRNAKV